MEQLEGIKKLAAAELDAIIKNGKFRSREEIDSVYKLIDIAKDITCIDQMEEDMYGESYDDGYGRSMRGSYDDGSYARGRRNARRDNMGRYSREGYARENYRNSYEDGRSMRGYSRDGKEDFKEHLREMMEDAPDEQTRQSIKRMLDTM